jgi:tetratricopeptide (TPR) repeat protein/transcriptional regulator with XRE-family HTH domain
MAVVDLDNGDLLFGEMVRAYRHRRGLSQEELAEATGLSVRALGKIESGRTGVPRPSTVRMLADALGLAGDERDRFVGAAAGGLSAPTVPRQLPADPSTFIGRAAQLGQLDALLPGGANRAADQGADQGAGRAAVVISAIRGTAGVGKTALAVHWGHRSAHQFPDGQLYVDLRGFSGATPLTPLEALARLMQSLGVPADQVPGDVDRAAALYRSVVAGRRILLVLDNAASADQVRPLLPGSGAAAVLVTSRDQLRGLIARDGARGLSLDVLSLPEAVALLGDLLGAGGRDGADGADGAAVAELAERCGRLPLALRIAAANLVSRPHLPIEEYIALLRGDDRLAALSVTGDPGGAVLASFDLSYRGLPAPARRMFRLLSVVPGPDVTVETAAAVAGAGADEARRLLDLLAGAHLVEEHRYGRYTCHDLLRGYADRCARRDEVPSERDAATRRYYDFAMSAVDAAARLLYPEKARLTVEWTPPAGQRPRWTPRAGRQPAAGYRFDDPQRASAWLADELPGLVAAVVRAQEVGPRPMAWLLADALRGYFWLNRSVVDWLAVGRAALAAAQAGGEPVAEAAAWLSLADAHQAGGGYRRAAQLYRRARQAGGAAGHAEEIQSAALNNLGWLHLRWGRLTDAADCYEQALAFNRRTGFVAGEAVQLGNLGSVHHAMGRLDEAAELCGAALALLRRLGLPRSMEASLLCELGEISHRRGRLDQAHRQLTEAGRLHRSVGDRAGEAETWLRMAAVDRDAGRPSTEVVGAALSAARQLRDSQLEAVALNILGSIEVRLGRHRQAVEHHRQAYETARDAELKQPEAEALVGLAWAYLHLGRATADEDPAGLARAHLGRARALAEGHGYRLIADEASAMLDLIGPRPCGEKIIGTVEDIV